MAEGLPINAGGEKFVVQTRTGVELFRPRSYRGPILKSAARRAEITQLLADNLAADQAEMAAEKAWREQIPFGGASPATPPCPSSLIPQDIGR